jgi:uncharacterized SAM-binding protein YcdF (DUF218 family)
MTVTDDRSPRSGFASVAEDPEPGAERRVVRKRFWRRLVLAGLFLAASLYPLALFAADPLLVRRDGFGTADALVVLGGDGPARAAWAAELWHRGAARQVLVTGDGDCGSIRAAMIEAKVDPAVIRTECRSRNTWENALYSAPILTEMNVRSAVIVTSWFHSRRAMETFKVNGPGIAWRSIPMERSEPWLPFLFGPDGAATFQEYPKTVWYWFRVWNAPPSAATGGLSQRSTPAGDRQEWPS